MKFKKLLSVLGLLAVATPATLSVVACGGNKSTTPTNPEETENDKWIVSIIQKAAEQSAIWTVLISLDTTSIETIKNSFVAVFKTLIEVSGAPVTWDDENINIIAFYDEKDKELGVEDFQYQDGKIFFSTLKINYDYGTVRDVTINIEDFNLQEEKN